MSSKLITFGLLLVMLAAAGCETSKAGRAHTPPKTKPAALDHHATQQLLEEAQKLRDRNFNKPPTFQVVDSADKLPAMPAPPPAAASERKLLGEQLFGAAAGAKLGMQAAPYQQLARFETSTNRIVYTRGDASAEQLRAAIVAALVAALDHQQFDPTPAAQGWDEQLALAAAHQATVTFALASYALHNAHPKLAPAMLARRPELITELPLVGRWIATDAHSGAAGHTLAVLQRAFVTREGWTLAAALFRSNGWSGVELAQLMPPHQCADVVRPDHWMSGEPIGQWTWPDEQTAPADLAGLVGPAVISMWLEDVVSPAQAQSVFAGYDTDAYRFFKPSAGHPARFEWLSLWNTPESAQQVARAFEKRLRDRFAGKGAADEHFVVFQKGLKVGVIISEEDAKARRKRAEHLLGAHHLELLPRQGLPVNFVPTRQDELVGQMKRATMKKRAWRDPATNLGLDLSVLGDKWRVEQPDDGPVRWFAHHQDGSLLQMTIELDNPLGPAFGTDAYRKKLVAAFEHSLDKAKLEGVAPTDVTPSRGLSLRLRGEVDGKTRMLQLWQFRQGDLVISYSLQAPPSAFEAHQAKAKAILQAAKTLAKSTPAKPEAAGGGTIKYKVETNSPE